MTTSRCLNQKMFNAEVEGFYPVYGRGMSFESLLQEKLEEKVDVSALETEREQLPRDS